MAISIDALLAVVLFIALITFISMEPTSQVSIIQSAIAANQLVDDAITAMDNTGFIMKSIESGKGEDINARLLELLPPTVEFRLEMLKYTSSLDDPLSECRDQKDFAKCFPDPYPPGEQNPKMFLQTMGEIPENKQIFHGRKIFIKKEPGDCEFEGELKQNREIKPFMSVIAFQGVETICDDTIDNDIDTLTDCEDPDCAADPACAAMTFTFSSTVESGGLPVTELECDQNATVILSIDRNANERLPVDIVFAAAKNDSMSECAIASSRPGTPLLSDGESQTRTDFELAFSFPVNAGDPPGAFGVLLSWASCSTNCPEFYVRNPNTDTNYGYGQLTTEQNSRACNEHLKTTQSNRAYYYNNRKYLDYLAVGSALVAAATWEVYVKNPNGISYNIEAKYIDNNHFDDIDVVEWDEPIAKVEIAKALIVDFTLRADWSVDPDPGDDWNSDQYAYAQIGEPTTHPQTGSNIQPTGHFMDAGYVGPPISVQLKNLDEQSELTTSSAYSYVLEHSGLINDALAANFPGYNRTKFAIVYGDSPDMPSSYNIDSAIADALDSNIFYYTIDLNENNWGGSVCQNQDLLDLAEQTGGSCYPAYDEGALAAILDIIAVEIGDRAGIDPDPLGVTITMDFPDDGFEREFLEEDSITEQYSWDEPTKTLQLQNITIISGLWSTSFDITILCDFGDCDSFFGEGKTVSMPPGSGQTTMDYDIGGESQPAVSWPDISIETVTVLYKDLLLDPDQVRGHFYGIDDVTIDYRVSNVGYFDVDLADINPTVDFYYGSSSLEACPQDGGTWLDSHYLGDEGIVDALYGNGGTKTFVDASKNLIESGYLCLYLNKPPQNDPPQKNVVECSANNWAVLNCAVPKTFVYLLDYWVWEK